MAEQRSEFVEMFVEFMIQTKDSPDGPLMQLRGILQQPASNEHFSVKISATEVSDRNHTLGNSLLQNPTELMPCLDEARMVMQQRLSVDPRAPSGLSVKENVHAVRARPVHPLPRTACRRQLPPVAESALRMCVIRAAAVLGS